MTHLYIELNNTVTEEVTNAIISKLYKLAVSGDLDETSYLKGRLHAPIAYARDVTYLNNNFPDLHVSAIEYAVAFEDSTAESICVTNWGNDGVVTLALLAAITTTNVNNVKVFKNNTNIVKFNEFLYFTGLTNPLSTTDNIFGGCTNLKEITLPPNLTAMAGNMFADCTSLEHITIPDSVTDLANPFINCTALQSIVVNGTINCKVGRTLNSLTEWVVNEGCKTMEIEGSTSLPSVNIPASVEHLRLRYCTALTTVTFALNSNLIDFGSLGGAFWKCTSLTTINNFPTGYTTLRASEFEQCSNLVTLVPLPVGCTSVPNSCFSQCKKMTGQMILPNSVTSIGNSSFYQCEKLTFDDISNIVTIGQQAFSGSGITSATIKNGATIGLKAFENCVNLLSVIFAGDVTCSGTNYNVFGGCTSLSSVTFTSDIQSLTKDCFRSCTSLTSIDMSHVLSLSEGMFGQCKNLASITLNSNLTSIPSSCFTYINNTTLHITIPASVTSIGNLCFLNSNVTVTMLSTTPPTLGSIPFGGSGTKVIYVPHGYLSTYQNAAGWSDVSSLLVESPS